MQYDRNGGIVLDEPSFMANNSRVIVVSLEDKSSKKAQLKDFFNLYGRWEDDRNIETIISDIRESRLSKMDIQL
ncbi:MAG: hypothetical protein LBV16_00145 [Elusimicrobiota bacterium]|jgi:hypothetical protein|nr:hypothetical protein [Elusimicrobiota bacterium]